MATASSHPIAFASCVRLLRRTGIESDEQMNTNDAKKPLQNPNEEVALSSSAPEDEARLHASDDYALGFRDTWTSDDENETLSQLLVLSKELSLYEEQADDAQRNGVKQPYTFAEPSACTCTHRQGASFATDATMADLSSTSARDSVSVNAFASHQYQDLYERSSAPCDSDQAWCMRLREAAEARRSAESLTRAKRQKYGGKHSGKQELAIELGGEMYATEH